MRSRAVALHSHDDDFEPADSELSTSHLNTGKLAAGSNLAYDPLEAPEREPDERPNTDWLRVLASQAEYADTFEDTLPEPPPKPSGMRLHSVPARIGPTLGTRLGLGLRRGSLILVIAVVAAGVVGAGVYGLTFTSWFSSLTAPAPASQPHATSGGPASTGGTQQGEQPAQAPIGGNQDSSVAPGGASDPKALVDRGVAEYKLGHYDQAIASLESATQAGAADAVTYYRLGLAYMAATGREHGLEDAEMAFRSAASLQPSWAAPRHMLAESLVRRGYFEGAIEPARQAAQLDPGQSENWMTLGRAYEGAGQEREAAQAFSEAARRSPSPPAKK